MTTDRPLIAFLDAKVLYGGEVRNFLMRLAMAEAFAPRWTDKVQDEWTSHLAENRPDITPAQLARIRSLMESHVVGAVVEGYEPLIETLSLPDLNDRHVLAAAITAEAKVIVTINLADFPSSSLESHGIEALHPDDFVVRLLETEPERVVAAAHGHRASLRRPPKTVAEYLASLDRNGFGETAAVLRQFVARL